LLFDIHSVIPKAKKMTSGLCGKGFAPSGHHISNKDANVRESIKVVYLLGMFSLIAKVIKEILLNEQCF